MRAFAAAELLARSSVLDSHSADATEGQRAAVGGQRATVGALSLADNAKDQSTGARVDGAAAATAGAGTADAGASGGGASRVRRSERVRARPFTGHRWSDRMARRLWISDAFVVGYALLGAHLLKFGAMSPAVGGASHLGLHLTYTPVTIALGLVWFVALSIADTRDASVLGTGAEEYRRIVGATVRIFAVVAIAAYLSQVNLARSYLVVALPVGTMLLLFERWLWRHWLVGVRRTGAWTDTVLAIGTPAEVAALAAELARTPAAGMRVVGTCLPTHEMPSIGEYVGIRAPVGPIAERAGGVLPVLGCVADLRHLLGRHGLHTVAVTARAGSDPELLRRIGWALEGTGVRLIVTPALTNIAGSRIHVQPVSGLALLHVAEPRLPRGGEIAKDLTDRVGALVLLALLSPVFAAVAIVVRLSSTGPVYFRQERVGRQGTVFSVWKFRSMRVDADDELAALLAAQNRGTTPLFKVAGDPRITRVGRFLRRSSLDELPQLINVLAGQMSLVGPRPQRAAEVELYDDVARRRLLTKPGMTGFWQVSGR